jgi:hypothetical protein
VSGRLSVVVGFKYSRCGGHMARRNDERRWRKNMLASWGVLASFVI